AAGVGIFFQFRQPTPAMNLTPAQSADPKESGVPTVDVAPPGESAPTFTPPVVPPTSGDRTPLSEPRHVEPAPPVRTDTQRADPAIVSRDVTARLANAARLFDAGDYDQSLSEYEAVLKSDPRNGVAAERLAS